MSSTSPPAEHGIFWQPERTFSPASASDHQAGTYSQQHTAAEPMMMHSSRPADECSYSCSSEHPVGAAGLQGALPPELASLGVIDANPSDLAAQLWAERQARHRAEGRMKVCVPAALQPPALACCHEAP
jgi:hypothetical protein